MTGIDRLNGHIILVIAGFLGLTTEMIGEDTYTALVAVAMVSMIITPNCFIEPL